MGAEAPPLHLGCRGGWEALWASILWEVEQPLGPWLPHFLAVKLETSVSPSVKSG